MCSARRRTQRAGTPALLENETFARLRFYLKCSRSSGQFPMQTVLPGIIEQARHPHDDGEGV